MIRNLKANKTVWLLVASLSLAGALIGVFNQDVYGAVIRPDLLPGTIAQDVITIIVGVGLLVLGWTTAVTDAKKQIFILSLLAYLFYGYGIYVIERIYTSLYLLYMALFLRYLFGLWSMGCSVSSKILCIMSKLPNGSGDCRLDFCSSPPCSFMRFG